jgi:nicotinamide mononucleotide transporter
LFGYFYHIMEDINLWLEIFAVLMGLLHVFLLTREKIIAWPFGLLSVSTYAWIFYDAQLYSDVILHFAYIVLNIYSWWKWSSKTNSSNQLPISYLNTTQRISLPLLTIFISFGLGWFMHQNTDADFPFGDAFTTVTSLTAQILLAFKKRENWILWIIVDIVAIAIYGAKGLYLTAALYLLYLTISVEGWRSWKTSE